VSARAAAPSPAATPGGTERPATTPTASAPAHHARVKVTPRAAVLAAALFLIAIIAIAPTRAVLEQRDRLTELERRADDVARTNDDLRRRIADLNDPGTLERLARECLGMVMPGETGFVAIPRGQAPTPPDCG
jgi:cell division protein FtsB